MRQVWIVLCAALCWGCFVFDELDQGQEVMKQLGPGDHGAAKPAAEAAPARAAEPTEPEGPGVLERLEAWWDDATAPEPVGPDPDDEIVACRVDGSMHFMRESDCQLRGGRTG